MPEKTLLAVADHGEVTGDTVTPHYADAAQVLDDIAAQGISYGEVTDLLESEGVEKFEASWADLLSELQAATSTPRSDRPRAGLRVTGARPRWQARGIRPEGTSA
jgi:transaldolase